jgi:cell wall-associated NlpC family hydrolase
MKVFVDWPRLKDVLSQQIGKPYLFGAEVNLRDTNPIKFDCSELVEWGYAQIGIKVPDGSYNQYDASIPVLSIAQFGDVSFFRKPDGTVYHVGMLFNNLSVIEARGNPYNKVKLTSINEWIKHPNFNGFRRLKAVLDV